MADVLEGAGFWLPSEFFADDDCVKGEEKANNAKKNVLASEFCFPTEFPYHFETGRDEFLESLLMSTSPQSTLGNWSGLSAGGSSNVSPNILASPPTTPPFRREDDAVGDLIYRVAGQVAKLKLNSGEGHGETNHTGFTAPQRSRFLLYPATQTPIPSVYQNTRVPQITGKQQDEGRGVWYGQRQQMYPSSRSLNPAAWAIPLNGPVNFRSGVRSALSNGLINDSGGGPALKKECAGTGVFIPRRYGTDNECNAYSSNSCRKTAPSSFLSERNPCPIPNGFDGAKAFVHPRSQISGGLSPNYDQLMARSNEMLLQYRRSLLLEKSLMAQEWYF